MKITSHLISGAGNTFHIVDEATNLGQMSLWPIEKRRHFVIETCKKNFADGLIYLKKSSILTWEFFNNDGSEAEMCGNATRCVGYYMSQVLKDSNSKWILQTSAGPIQIEKINDNSYQITMTPVKILKSTKGFFCDTGVPHLVIEIKDIEVYLDFKEEASALRFHPEFQPKGTNVTFVQLLPEIDKIKAVSFERGVEDFTQACGTGAMAAATYNLMKRSSKETQVEMPGGTLMMNLTNLAKPRMTGPATLLGKYEYESSN